MDGEIRFSFLPKLHMPHAFLRMGEGRLFGYGVVTYSLSTGLYAGVSLDGKVLVTRNRVNEKFYGRIVSGMEILQGHIPTPTAARPLYDALQRYHVYATGNVPHRRQPQQVLPKSPEMEYGLGSGVLKPKTRYLCCKFVVSLSIY
jgi:hypothetical protein